jgi:hypothetical protein
VNGSYFTTSNGDRFHPTEHCRGPWDEDACHAGPPVGLMVRAMEPLAPAHRLSRVTVELIRPIPMAGFRVRAEVSRGGRSVVLTQAEIFDEDRVYARAVGLHLRTLGHLDCTTTQGETPRFERAVPGRFPIKKALHGRAGFIESLEIRYDPDESQGDGGPTTLWMRTVPLLEDEEPSGFQRLCPLADSGNGLSYNDYQDRVRFVNPDLTIAAHRQPQGEWFCSKARSYWEQDGVGLADAELFDVAGHLGRALQTLLLDPAGD